jgi:hypothetical protein
MLSVYRRHVTGRKNRSRRRRNCRCPIWVAGTLYGEAIKRSIDLSNWEAAVRLVREWEISKPSGTVTIGEACARFLSDAEARKLREGSLLKYRQAAKALEPLADHPLRQVSVEDIRRLRESWKIAGITMQKRLETLRSLFKFCVESGWIETNPAAAVKGSKVSQPPTLPFTDKQLRACLKSPHSILFAGSSRLTPSTFILSLAWASRRCGNSKSVSSGHARKAIPGSVIRIVWITNSEIRRTGTPRTAFDERKESSCLSQLY